MTINQKLATIQTKFKSKKSRFNSFGKYYFRSAEDILEAIKPYLLEIGVAVTINEELIAADHMPIIKTTAKLIDEKGLELEGTITGEHGIGLQKKHYLLKQHPDNLTAMKSIKRRMDPNNIMNPGKVFDIN